MAFARERSARQIPEYACNTRKGRSQSFSYPTYSHISFKVNAAAVYLSMVYAPGQQRIGDVGFWEMNVLFNAHRLHLAHNFIYRNCSGGLPILSASYLKINGFYVIKKINLKLPIKEVIRQSHSTIPFLCVGVQIVEDQLISLTINYDFVAKLKCNHEFLNLCMESPVKLSLTITISVIIVIFTLEHFGNIPK